MDAQQAAVTGDTDFTNPRWRYPEYGRGSVIEIRVHGVGGEPPSRMARDPEPRLVGGDRLGGFWRARNPVVREPAGPGKPGVYREVLSWGGQTSGSTLHALWVLLLPFALFNVAGRMHVVVEPTTGAYNRARAAAHRAVCRSLGLSLTLTAVTMLCAIAFGPVAECDAACAERSRVLNALLVPLRAFDSLPDSKLALLALLPIAMLVGLWLAGRYSTDDLESYGSPAKEADHDGDRGRRRDNDPDVEAITFAHPGFWQNEWPASRLRSLHLSAGYACIAGSLGLALQQPDALARVAAAIAWVAVAMALGAVTLPSVLHRRQDAAWTVTTVTLRLAAVGSLGLVAGRTISLEELADALDLSPDVLRWLMIIVGASLAFLWFSLVRSEVTSARPRITIWRDILLAPGALLIGIGLPSTASVAPLASTGLPRWISEQSVVRSYGTVLPDGQRIMPAAYLPLVALIAIQVVLILILLACSISRTTPLDHHEIELERRAVPLNLGAAIAALLAVFVLAAVGTSLHLLITQWLQAGSDQPAGPPDLYKVTTAVVALVFPVALAVSLIGFQAWRGIRLRRMKPPDDVIYADLTVRARAYEGSSAPPPASAPLGWFDGVRKSWMTQILIRNGGRILLGMVLLGAALVVTDFFRRIGGGSLVAELPDNAAAVFVTINISLVVGAVTLIRRSLRDQALRRTVGRGFDVLTFFPRVTHPFAPPCYGEKVVPLLAARIRWLTGADPSDPDVSDRCYRVVVAAHSQGTVVAMAAVALAYPKDGNESGASKVAMITYGSPIASLYRRFFRPTTHGVIEQVGSRVELWHNVMAMSEPLGWPIWRTSVGELPSDGPDQTGAATNPMACRAGWPLHLRLPHPADRWEPAPEPGEGVDLVITDPHPLREPLRTVWSLPEGHGSYHDSRELDDHLLAIATHLVERDRDCSPAAST